MDQLRERIQKAIPTVYDESLSYYEVLQSVIEALNVIGESFDEFLDIAEEVGGKLDTLNAQIYQIVVEELDRWLSDGTFNTAVGGVLDPLISEVETARAAYPNLDARLDALEAKDALIDSVASETLSFERQLDFVEFVRNYCHPFTQMTLIKEGTWSFRIEMASAEQKLIYKFTKDANDDFIKLYSGSVVKSGTTYIVLHEASNKEYAFMMTTQAGNNWLPEHNGVGSQFNMISPQLVCDGAIVDLGVMSVGASLTCKSMSLTQKQSGRVAGVDICVIDSYHKLDLDGIVNFEGGLKITKDCTITTGYTLMMPANSGVAETFVSGTLNTLVNDYSDTYTYFASDKNRVYSGAIVSSTNKNILGACRVNNPLLSLRLNKTLGKPMSGKELFIWNRTNSPKMYWQPMENLVCVPGDVFKWSSAMTCGYVDQAYTYILGGK